jgi:hypothetical protein
LLQNTYSPLVVPKRAFARNAAFTKTAFYPKTRIRRLLLQIAHSHETLLLRKPLFIQKHVIAGKRSSLENAVRWKTQFAGKHVFAGKRSSLENTYSLENAVRWKTQFAGKRSSLENAVRWKPQFAGNRFVVSKHEFTENPKNRFNKQNRLLFFFNKTRIFPNRDKSFFVRKKEKKESKILLQGH